MIEIRPIRQGEGDAARSVIYITAGQYFYPELTGDTLFATLRVEWPLNDIDGVPNRYTPPDGLFLVALDEGRIIGTGAVRRYDAATAELKRLWLLPDYQGRKIGYRLMGLLLEFSRQQGYQRMILTTNRFQERAIAFYLKLGFRFIPMFNDADDTDENERALGMDL